MTCCSPQETRPDRVHYWTARFANWRRGLRPCLFFPFDVPRPQHRPEATHHDPAADSSINWLSHFSTLRGHTRRPLTAKAPLVTINRRYRDPDHQTKACDLSVATRSSPHPKIGSRKTACSEDRSTLSGHPFCLVPHQELSQLAGRRQDSSTRSSASRMALRASPRL